MSRNKKPRKAYKPKPVALNAHELAIGGAALLPESTIRDLQHDMPLWLEAFTRGEDCLRHWESLADVANVAEELSNLRICHDANSRRVIAEGQDALAAVCNRRHAGGSWTLHAAELQALRDLVTWHSIQLDQACHTEYTRAYRKVQRTRYQASRGNVAKGVRVLTAPAA